MAIDISVILGVLQIVIQLVAVYFSYIIFTFNRLNKAWLAVILALILMTIRRFTVLLTELDALPALTGTIQFIDRIILPFAISIFLAVGLFTMMKKFETFEVVEKATKKKIKDFIESKRR